MQFEEKKRQSHHLVYPLHGGNRNAAAKSVGMCPEDLTDFSASINPLGPPQCVLELMKSSAEYLREYPDSSASSFRTALAQHLNISSDWITAGNGSTELIYLIPRLWDAGRRVALVTPCFSEYERAFKLADVPVDKISLTPDNGFHPEAEHLLFKFQGIKNLGGIVIGHPLSPVGNMWKKEILTALIQYCEKRSLFLIVDETFIDFCGEEHSLASQITSHKKLILIRSMTKFYALPGLRLGYGIMHPEWTQSLERHRIPWSVNTIAQAVGVCLLGDRDYATSSREFIRQERTYLYEGLSEITGLKVFHSDSNFLLFHLVEGNEAESARLYTHLLRDGLLIRNCGNFDGLNQTYFRIAIKTHRENALLLASLKKHLGSV